MKYHCERCKALMLIKDFKRPNCKRITYNRINVLVKIPAGLCKSCVRNIYETFLHQETERVLHMKKQHDFITL